MDSLTTHSISMGCLKIAYPLIQHHCWWPHLEHILSPSVRFLMVTSSIFSLVRMSKDKRRFSSIFSLGFVTPVYFLVSARIRPTWLKLSVKNQVIYPGRFGLWSKCFCFNTHIGLSLLPCTFPLSLSPSVCLSLSLSLSLSIVAETVAFSDSCLFFNSRSPRAHLHVVGMLWLLPVT